VTPADLTLFKDAITARHTAMTGVVDQMDAAPEDAASLDLQADAYAEALFLRAFTAYENDVERLFLHYVTGGATISGATAATYLNLTDEAAARKLTKAGFKFLSWAKPAQIRETANTYILNGWPIADMMSAKAQDLADCEKIRNRIAHSSVEALVEFNSVQRNLLRTERLFPITPGQFLRIRNARLRRLHIGHYFSAMHDTLMAILDPPD
jgi:hypothetical protein